EQLLVPRALQDGDRQVLDPDISGEGDAPQVVHDRIVEVDRTPGPGTGDELFNLRDRGQVGEASRLHRHQHRNRVDMAARYLARALDWIHTQVDFALSALDHEAKWQVGLVARAQGHGPGQAGALERTPHRVTCRVAYTVRIALAEESRACKRGCLGGVQQLDRKLCARLERRNPASLLFH